MYIYTCVYAHMQCTLYMCMYKCTNVYTMYSICHTCIYSVRVHIHVHVHVYVHVTHDIYIVHVWLVLLMCGDVNGLFFSFGGMQ